MTNLFVVLSARIRKLIEDLNIFHLDLFFSFITPITPFIDYYIEKSYPLPQFFAGFQLSFSSSDQSHIALLGYPEHSYPRYFHLVLLTKSIILYQK